MKRDQFESVIIIRAFLDDHAFAFNGYSEKKLTAGKVQIGPVVYSAAAQSPRMRQVTAAVEVHSDYCWKPTISWCDHLYAVTST